MYYNPPYDGNILVIHQICFTEKCHENTCGNGGTCFETAEGNVSCTCKKDCKGRYCENCIQGRELICTLIEILSPSTKRKKF